MTSEIRNWWYRFCLHDYINWITRYKEQSPYPTLWLAPMHDFKSFIEYSEIMFVESATEIARGDYISICIKPGDAHAMNIHNSVLDTGTLVGFAFMHEEHAVHMKLLYPEWLKGEKT